MSYGFLGLLIALLRDEVHRRVSPDKGQHAYDEDEAEQDRYPDEEAPDVSLQKFILQGLGGDPREGEVGHQGDTGAVEADAEGVNRVKQAEEVRRTALLHVAEGGGEKETATYAIDQAS